MHGLTAKQREILDYIKHYIEIHHYSPSLEEIKSHFSYSSLSTIHEHLVALKKKKAIDFTKGAKRSISFAPEPKHFTYSLKIPIVGFFSSGLPLEIFQKQDLFYEFSSAYKNTKSLYVLKVHGNGLLNELIQNQDLLIIEAKTDLEDGDVALISLKSGSTYVKKLFYEKDSLRLETLHPFGDSLSETFNKDELIIRGKLISIIRNF